MRVAGCGLLEFHGKLIYALFGVENHRATRRQRLLLIQLRFTGNVGIVVRKRSVNDIGDLRSGFFQTAGRKTCGSIFELAI